MRAQNLPLPSQIRTVDPVQLARLKEEFLQNEPAELSLLINPCRGVMLPCLLPGWGVEGLLNRFGTMPVLLYHPKGLPGVCCVQ